MEKRIFPPCIFGAVLHCPFCIRHNISTGFACDVHQRPANRHLFGFIYFIFDATLKGAIAHRNGIIHHPDGRDLAAPSVDCDSVVSHGNEGLPPYGKSQQGRRSLPIYYPFLFSTAMGFRVWGWLYRPRSIQLVQRGLAVAGRKYTSIPQYRVAYGCCISDRTHHFTSNHEVTLDVLPQCLTCACQPEPAHLQRLYRQTGGGAPLAPRRNTRPASPPTVRQNAAASGEQSDGKSNAVGAHERTVGLRAGVRGGRHGLGRPGCNGHGPGLPQRAG